MKIQFISKYSQLYGANRSLLTLIEYFHLKGYDVNVLLPSKGSMVDKLHEKNIAYQIIPYYAPFLYIRPVFKHLLVPILGVFNFFVFPFILYKVKKNNPDIIYSNSSAENIGIFIAKILKKKHISHIREFMYLDYNLYFVFGKRAKRNFINLSDGSIYVSKAVLKSVQGDNAEDITHKVIYNGINCNRNKLQVKKINRDKIIFGIVGILDPGKGQHIAIEYFKKILKYYPNAMLYIYGDKECAYKHQIVKLVNSLDIIEKVKFCGFVNNQDEIYKNIDFLLMFSKSEGFGRVTIEAALQGIPVIGFDNAGTSELIIHKQTGCLFSDYDSFIKSVNYLIDEEGNYDKIRNNAFINALKVYNEEIYCKNVRDFINVITNNYSKK